MKNNEVCRRPVPPLNNDTVWVWICTVKIVISCSPADNTLLLLKIHMDFWKAKLMRFQCGINSFPSHNTKQNKKTYPWRFGGPDSFCQHLSRWTWGTQRGVVQPSSQRIPAMCTGWHHLTVHLLCQKKKNATPHHLMKPETRVPWGAHIALAPSPCQHSRWEPRTRNAVISLDERFYSPAGLNTINHMYCTDAFKVYDEWIDAPIQKRLRQS